MSSLTCTIFLTCLEHSLNRLCQHACQCSCTTCQCSCTTCHLVSTDVIMHAQYVLYQHAFAVCQHACTICPISACICSMPTCMHNMSSCKHNILIAWTKCQVSDVLKFACLFICMWPGICVAVPLAVCPPRSPFLHALKFITILLQVWVLYRRAILEKWTYQGNIRSLFETLPYYNQHGPFQEAENAVCLSSSTGNVIWPA